MKEFQQHFINNFSKPYQKYKQSKPDRHKKQNIT